MTDKEALDMFQAQYDSVYCFPPEKDAIGNAIEALKAKMENKETTLTCDGCVFIGKKSWDMPCLRCKRIAEDFWKEGKS